MALSALLWHWWFLAIFPDRSPVVMQQPCPAWSIFSNPGTRSLQVCPFIAVFSDYVAKEHHPSFRHTLSQHQNRSNLVQHQLFVRFRLHLEQCSITPQFESINTLLVTIIHSRKWLWEKQLPSHWHRKQRNKSGTSCTTRQRMKCLHKDPSAVKLTTGRLRRCQVSSLMTGLRIGPRRHQRRRSELKSMVRLRTGVCATDHPWISGDGQTDSCSHHQQLPTSIDHHPKTASSKLNHWPQQGYNTLSWQ